MDHIKFMEVALEESAVARSENNRAFAAVLVKSGKVVAKSHNRVVTSNNPIEHAELSLIREYCNKNKIADLHGYILYSICEPCPMCASACVWANISTIVYGCDNTDGPTDYDRQNQIRCQDVIKKSGKDIKIIKHVSAEKCKQIFID